MPPPLGGGGFSKSHDFFRNSAFIHSETIDFRHPEEENQFFEKNVFLTPTMPPPPRSGFLKSRIFLENRFFPLQTLFLPSGARKSVFSRKKCSFDPDANGHTHTHTQTIFFHMYPPYSRGNKMYAVKYDITVTPIKIYV